MTGGAGPTCGGGITLPSTAAPPLPLHPTARPHHHYGLLSIEQLNLFGAAAVLAFYTTVPLADITRSASFTEGVSGSEFRMPVSDAVLRWARSFGMFSPQMGQFVALPPKQRTPEALQRAAEAMMRLDRRAFRGGLILDKILRPVSSDHIDLRTAECRPAGPGGRDPGVGPEPGPPTGASHPPPFLPADERRNRCHGIARHHPVERRAGAPHMGHRPRAHPPVAVEGPIRHSHAAAHALHHRRVAQHAYLRRPWDVDGAGVPGCVQVRRKRNYWREKRREENAPPATIPIILPLPPRVPPASVRIDAAETERFEDGGGGSSGRCECGEEDYPASIEGARAGDGGCPGSSPQEEEGPADTDVDVPCTIRTEEEDPRTAMDVVSIADKAIVRKAARSVVGIVSRVPDGKEIMQCSGIIVDWNETSKLATIVTCSAAVCYDGALVHPKPNLRILLPNNTNVEGQLLFFNARYNIALLEAMVDSPLEPANFGSCPNFGQKVFALARDHKASLFARHGSILFQEPPSFFVDKYWLSLSSEVALCGTGGPAIDEHGNVVGMTFGRLPYPDILSISILQTCIDMWRRHRFINNPSYYCIFVTILFIAIKLWR
uniref:Uncharacterized protein n=1 Tax=Oryza brachyantha TaxID=4533 RepID=J3M472_ORYBR